MNALVAAMNVLAALFRRIEVSVLAMVLVLLLAQAAEAQQGNCHRLANEAEVRVCLSREAAMSDSSLRVMEDSLVKQLGGPAAAALRAASEKWRGFRVAQCSAVAAQWAGGDYGPVTRLECWIDLTNERRRFLHRSYPRRS